MKKWLMYVVAVCFILTGFISVTYAQKYPSQPISMVVGVAPGGVVDIAARSLSEEAKKILGVEVLVSNKAGASSTVAVSAVGNARPDGYTLGSVADTPYVRAPHLLELDFNPLADSTPIIMFGQFHSVLLVKDDSPFKTLQDLVDYSKKNPKKLTYGQCGPGCATYMGFAGFALPQVDVTYVPFPGDAPTLLALLGGHVMCAGLGTSNAVPYIKSGKVRVLASVEGDKRIPGYPNTPTFNELVPSTVVIQPPGLLIFGPKGLPQSIVNTLGSAFDKAHMGAAFRKFCVDSEVYPLDPPIVGQKLQAYLEVEYKKNGDLAKKLGLKKEKPQ